MKQFLFGAFIAGAGLLLIQKFIDITREPYNDYQEDWDPEAPEHLDSPDCWCHPVMVFKDDDSGNEVWVHKGNGEELAPSWIIAEAIADAIAGRCE